MALLVHQRPLVAQPISHFGGMNGAQTPDTLDVATVTRMLGAFLFIFSFLLLLLLWRDLTTSPGQGKKAA